MGDVERVKVSHAIVVQLTDEWSRPVEMKLEGRDKDGDLELVLRHDPAARISELERERDEARRAHRNALELEGRVQARLRTAEATIQRVREEVERWPKKFGHTQRILSLLSQESEPE